MKTYGKLQIKRVLKLLPVLLASVMVLVACLGVLLAALLRADSQSESKTRMRIAVVGNTEKGYMDIGLLALESFDSSRFALEVVMMTEEEALEALKNGSIVSFVQFPEGFVEDALHGKIARLPYKTLRGTVGLSSLFEQEITEAIAEFVLHAQKGSYGSNDALRAAGDAKDLPAKMNEISLEYADLILRRSEWYRTTEFGVGDSLGFGGYLACGISVVLLLLAALPFSLLFIRRDLSLCKVLAAKGYGSVRQVFAEVFALFFGLCVLLFMIVLLLFFGGRFGVQLPDFPQGQELFLFFVQALPVVFMIAAFSLMIFTFTEHIVSGVLLHFVSSLVLAYLSGCLYPIYTFPDAVQVLARFLPTGIARTYFASCITGNADLWSGLILLLFGVVFFGVTVLVRHGKRKGRR